MSAETAQQRFDRTYISAAEIMKRLKVARPTITRASKQGILPDPIVACDAMLWERDIVEENLQAWERLLTLNWVSDCV